MATITLVNPRRRKRRKMTAKQAKYFGKRRKRRATKAAAPKRRRRRRVAARKSNPAPRRRRAIGYTVGSRRIRRRKMNPSIRGITGQVMPTIKSGFIGALGALGLDALHAQTSKYLPVSLQTGYANTAVKLLEAVLVGMIGNFALRGRGRALAEGAATVVIHDALKPVVAGFGVPMGAYIQNVGAYIQESVPAQMGYVNPAGVVEGASEYSMGGLPGGDF